MASNAYFRHDCSCTLHVAKFADTNGQLAYTSFVSRASLGKACFLGEMIAASFARAIDDSLRLETHNLIPKSQAVKDRE